MKILQYTCILSLALFCHPSARAAGSEFLVGIGTHVTSDRGMDLISGAGISSIRDDIHWDEVERDKGVLAMPERYDRYVTETLRKGIKPVLVLCYGNRFYDDGDFPVSGAALEGFARFAEFVARHFQGRVQIYEVWNEWNYGIGLPSGVHAGDPLRYAALLTTVYPKLKAVDPQIIVLGGAMSGNGVRKGWFESACTAGLLDHLDALSYHPYCWRESGVERTPEEGFMKLVSENYKIVQRYGRNGLPVYLTEVGWPTHTGDHSTTPDESALFLTRTFLLARTLPFIKGVWWYDFRDDGKTADPIDPEHNYGIVFNDFSPKPAYFAMRAICRLFFDARFASVVPANPGAHILEFRKDSGEIQFVVWSASDNEDHHAVLESSNLGEPSPAQITEITGAKNMCVWELQGKLWNLHVKMSTTPKLIETSLTDVKILADENR